jgi:hypothetical protein
MEEEEGGGGGKGGDIMKGTIKDPCNKTTVNRVL